MDILLYESGDGGEMSLQGGDIQTTSAIFNYVYLSLFGGNVEASTPDVDPPRGVERQDYWANVYSQSEPENLFNSEYERIISNIVINTGTLQLISEAAKADLSWMEELSLAVIEEVTTYLEAVGRTKTIIKLREPSNNEASAFAVIWDATKSEAIVEAVI